MSFIRKTLTMAALAMVAISASAQDLIAKQAPSDKRMKEVNTVKIKGAPAMSAADLNNPASAIYTDWNNDQISRLNGKMPANYKVDLRGFSMPTSSRKVTSNYGARWGRQHAGIDVKVYIGDTIKSAFDGKVRIVKYDGNGYGYYVVVRHPNGLETLYGHLSKQLVKPNQIVRAGQPIGLGGNTGRSTGSHLHFETRILGQAVNPALMFDFEHQDVTGDFYAVNSGTVTNRHTASRSAAQAPAAQTSTAQVEKKAAQNAKANSKSNNSTKAPKESKPQDNNQEAVVSYSVKDGDTLFSIARAHGITLDQLLKLNGLNRQSVIHKGQTLRCS